MKMGKFVIWPIWVMKSRQNSAIALNEVRLVAFDAKMCTKCVAKILSVESIVGLAESSENWIKIYGVVQKPRVFSSLRLKTHEGSILDTFTCV